VPSSARTTAYACAVVAALAPLQADADRTPPRREPRSHGLAVAERAPAGRRPSTVAALRDVVSSPGRPLDPATRTLAETGFGRSFAEVRLHTDERAAASARAFGALAYTVGPHIAFAPGQYAPDTAAGRRLLLHEVAHVAQQSAGSVSAADAARVAPGDGSHEHEARHAADGVGSRAAGAPRLSRAPVGVQRQVDAGAQAQPQAQPQAQVAPVQQEQAAADPNAPAPTTTTTTAPTTGPAGMPAKLRFWFQAFIPNTLGGAHTQPTGPYAGRQVFEGPPLPFHYNSCFETDDRGFDPRYGASSRMRFMIEFDTATGTATLTSGADLTFEVDCTTGSIKCTATPRPSTSITTIPPLLPSSRRYDVTFAASANDPCVTGSPNIAIRGNLIIDLAAREVQYRPLITLFPAIEMYADVGGGTVTCFTHSPSTSSVFTLFVPGVMPTPGRLTF
jgi:Domain of unknown function (DUF4157)